MPSDTVSPTAVRELLRCRWIGISRDTCIPCEGYDGALLTDADKGKLRLRYVAINLTDGNFRTTSDFAIVSSADLTTYRNAAVQMSGEEVK